MDRSHTTLEFFRPKTGGDYVADSEYEVCMKPPKGSDESDLFALKYLLKQNPKKNLELAHKFFNQMTRSSFEISDYDDQAIIDNHDFQTLLI